MGQAKLRRQLMQTASIPAMSRKAIAQVYRLEERQLQEQPQIDIKMHHVLHAGLYARTMLLPAGYQITGALIKIPTVLVIHGDAMVWTGEDTQRITGYAVLPAAANRKQVIAAVTDIHMTMLFPTSATTVAEAEQEFTDEADRLASRRDTALNEVVITGGEQ
jgi:hypothetical protein